MRFGLVGTGFWAREAHAPALAAAPSASLDAVWGRDPDATRALAEAHGARATSSFDELLEQVDAVAFAVPPDVQAGLAVRAAAAGKHLLLDKPVATRRDLADGLAEAVERTGVASSVFFTSRFQRDTAGWLEEARQHPWTSVEATWICAAFEPGGPFASSPWRREKGALWDVGPHALSLVLPLLGEVSDVTARRGHGDLVHVLLEHASGATSTLDLTLGAPPSAVHVGLLAWGEDGQTSMPESEVTAVEALGVAVEDLVARAATGDVAHPCDVSFGRYVVEVLSRVEEALPDRGGAGRGPR
jgi:predicted dehydrogenase